MWKFPVILSSSTREVHLETGQLRLFMQTEACCGEAPEVALSILGHWTLFERVHLLGS